MKYFMKYILSLVIVFASMLSNSQNSVGKSDDAARITLAAYVPKQIDQMPEAARSNLSNKLTQVVTQNGLGGKASNERFIITANINVISKEMTPTAPPMQAFVLEITLYIGDAKEGTKFSSVSIQTKGLGESETKAYIDALKKIKPADPAIQNFVEEGKVRIMEFYNSQCDFIITEAKSLSGQGKFDEALSKLASVPTVCKDCYQKLHGLIPGIYQQKIDSECKKILNEANGIWKSKQNLEGAEAASKVLKNIAPGSSCSADADKLVGEIAKRVYELDKREWDFKLQVYQDGVDMEKAVINAARDIGVAYANNQPDVIYNYETTILSWW